MKSAMVGLLTCMCLVLLPGVALADVEFCESNEDCSIGFICQLDCVSSCPECDDCVDYMQCIAGTPSCELEECPDGLTCVVVESGACSGFDGCEDGEDCIAPEPECEYFTEAVCLPPYQAPCDEDADCGPGFACENLDTSVCTCLAPEPGTDEEELCLCGDVPEGDSYCRLIRAECHSNDDCDHGFDCILEDGDLLLIEPVCHEMTCDEMDPVIEEAPTGYCAPPGYDTHFGPGGEENVARPGADPEENAPGELGAGNGSKPEPGCNTASGSASLVLILLALVGVLRRRERQVA